MAKKIAVLMAIICIGLGAFVVNYKLGADNKGPEIIFENDEFVYNEQMSDSELLSGVTAMDDKDGDVTDSLAIENAYAVSDTDVVIVYVAKDSKNNITKARRSVKTSDQPFSDVGTEQDTENTFGSDLTTVPGADIAGANITPTAGAAETTGDLPANPTGETDESVTTESDDVTIGVPVEEENEADKAREEQETLADNMPAGCPRIYLTDYWIEVPVGTTIDAISYIRTIEDESENFFELSRKVQIYDSQGGQPGANISFTSAGTYEYTFYVVDKQSNTSNMAKLVVVAK